MDGAEDDLLWQDGGEANSEATQCDSELDL
jgi:hypothetical protein